MKTRVSLKYFVSYCGLIRNQIGDLLLEKEKFWIVTLITQHQGLNSTHDWNRSKRTEREKINN